MNPKVSIIIPVYNGADFLGDAVRSALSQTYRNVEVIVINDGSDDDNATENVAASFGDKIKYYNKTNGGVSSALNFGINLMQGEYFAWLSHDDIFMHDKIEKEVSAVKLSDKTYETIIFTNWLEVDAAGRPLYAVYANRKSRRNSYAAVFNHHLNGCTMLIPKKCFLDSGTFDENLRSTQDYDLWFKFAGKYDFIHLKDFTLKSRVHRGQGTNRIKGHKRNQNELHIRFLNCIPEEEVRKIDSDPAKFFLKRAVNLSKEGIIMASETAYKKYLSRTNGSVYGLTEKWYSFLCSKAGGAFRYIMKMMLFPARWGMLLKLIAGRLRSRR